VKFQERSGDGRARRLTQSTKLASYKSHGAQIARCGKVPTENTADVLGLQAHENSGTDVEGIEGYDPENSNENDNTPTGYKCHLDELRISNPIIEE
jgi:hypothetical protein